MSLSITQTPALVSLAQSPIIFTLAESSAELLTSSSFQYVGELRYWQGGQFASSSVANYTITKYPNTSGVGIFDLSRIINSTLTDLAIQNQSNVEYFSVDFYTQYLNGTLYVTGSHLRSSTYKALDGYGIFQEPIGQNVTSASAQWPLMTNGPVTQSVLIDDVGTNGIYVGTAGGIEPTKIVYTSNLGNGNYTFATGSTSSSLQIQQYPVAPAQAGFPLSTSGLTYFTTQAYSGSVALGTSIKYEIVQQQKYPNIRIMFKNRFGQFDWFSFYMVNRQSLTTTKRTYQPQLGSWNSTSLSYNKYDSSNLTYIVDSAQAIQVNSFWIPEEYNDTLKQLMVSDEIYWMYDSANGYVRPLTIITSNIQFKTGVNDHLIQYQFDFNYGQAYKLII